MADRRAGFAGNDHGAARFLALHWLARATAYLICRRRGTTYEQAVELSPLLRFAISRGVNVARPGLRWAARLWWVQVARGAEWTARIRGSSEATVRIPSVRGEIRDRNGTSLVQKPGEL